MAKQKITETDMENALTQYPNSLWVKQAALLAKPRPPGRYAQAGVYGTTRASYHPQVTVRLPRPGETQRGKPKKQNRCMDLVAFIMPHYKTYRPALAGVEIKVTKQDLLGDQKLTDYLPYCHQFYLACPVALGEVAEARLNRDWPGVGLLLIHFEPMVYVQVARLPELYKPTTQHLMEVYAELLLKPLKNPPSV